MITYLLKDFMLFKINMINIKVKIFAQMKLCFGREKDFLVFF